MNTLKNEKDENDDQTMQRNFVKKDQLNKSCEKQEPKEQKKTLKHSKKNIEKTEKIKLVTTIGQSNKTD